MPSQQVEIAEAIAGIKRALKRAKEAPSDKPVVTASNRGNKLHQGAKYVHEGSLTFSSGPEVYKQKIEHAGYTRYILERNPRRYNEYGEELEDSETDEEADADAADQNAYSGIRLEELLCPLKHPSELPIHPTMSQAYLSSALPDMVLSTHETLRQERANLWRAKYLNRQLTGDASWIPAGEVESADDWELFEPRSKPTSKQPLRKRKRHGPGHEGENEPVDHSSEAQAERHGVSKWRPKGNKDSLLGQTSVVDGSEDVERDHGVTAVQTVDGDAADGLAAPSVLKDGAPEAANVSSNAVALERTIDTHGKTKINGFDLKPSDQDGTGSDMKGRGHSPNLESCIHFESRSEMGKDVAGQVSHAVSEIDNGSPPPPIRRITRALAANHSSNSHSNAPTPPLSPASSSTTTSSSSQLQIDPLYLVPRSANPSNSAKTFPGLLLEEALETRRLLTLYIQKLEESVRGYEAILSKLLTAQRLRTEVLEMCKTEEHVGELSDGEDWIDAERWGLQPGELRKGKDEDDDVIEENTIGGRKGKRRARN